MNISLFGFSDFIPSDVIAAWVFTIVIGAIITFFVLKQKKLPVIWDYMRTTNHRKIGTLYLLLDRKSTRLNSSH